MLSKTFKNNDSIDCSICYNETNGIKMDYHTYLKYEEIWRRCKTADKQPLVKCIKCNNYTCINCKNGWKTLYIGCPFNCHELD